jgi:creatinine amidohydrolase
MTLRTVFWQKLRRPEIAAARDEGAVVLVPIGSTEQHGAHLAVDMDVATATAVCARAAVQVAEFPVLVAPPVWSGYSPHHMDFPGTITLRFSTFAAVVTDVVDSILFHGFRHIVLINGHGGNIGHLTALSTKLGTTGRSVAFASWWDLIGADFASLLDGDLKGVGHACEAETSCYLALDPAGVDLRLAVRTDSDSHVVSVDQSAFSTAGVRFPSIFMTGSSGVHGDPTRATAEKGEKILSLAAGRLAAFIRSYRDVDLGQARSLLSDI